MGAGSYQKVTRELPGGCQGDAEGLGFLGEGSKGVTREVTIGGGVGGSEAKGVSHPLHCKNTLNLVRNIALQVGFDLYIAHSIVT